MKNKIVFSSIILGLVALYGCPATSTPEPVAPVVVPSFTCTVDGNIWSADPSQLLQFPDEILRGVDFSFSSAGSVDFDLDIAAFQIADGDTTMIQGEILFGTGSIVGTHTLSFANEGESSMIFVEKSGGQSLLESFFTSYEGYLGDADESISPGTQVGTFTISAYDEVTKKMSGTFSFTQASSADASPLLPSVSVTRGKFTDIVVGD